MAAFPHFVAWLRRHRWACFALMTLGFIAFGLLTLDLVKLLGSNAAFLFDNGWQGLLDGGLRQLLELLVSCIGAMAAWLLFKLCETLLIQSFTNK
jgi:hypothetical protein